MVTAKILARPRKFFVDLLFSTRTERRTLPSASSPCLHYAMWSIMKGPLRPVLTWNDSYRVQCYCWLKENMCRVYCLSPLLELALWSLHSLVIFPQPWIICCYLGLIIWHFLWILFLKWPMFDNAGLSDSWLHRCSILLGIFLSFFRVGLFVATSTLMFLDLLKVNVCGSGTSENPYSVACVFFRVYKI